MRQMASEAEMGCESMQKIIRKDLKMTAYHLQKCQLLSAMTMQKRLQRAKLLQKWMKAQTDTSIIWTDEKIFTVQTVHNHHDRILAQNIKTVPMNKKIIFCRQHTASIIVWGDVTSCGKITPLIFIPEGLKVNLAVNLTMLKDKVLLWINSQRWQGSYCFQQDGAPSHTANKV